MCPCALVPHKGVGRKEKRYVGLAPWSEETVVSCHTLTVVPRATDRASLQRPRIYLPQAGPHNLFGLCWRTGPTWHFSSFRAVRSPVFPGCQQYLGRPSQTAFCRKRSAHSPSGPCFLRGDKMIYACYLNVAGLAPWWDKYGLEPSESQRLSSAPPYPMSPLAWTLPQIQEGEIMPV